MSKKDLCGFFGSILLGISLLGGFSYIIPRKLATNSKLPILPPYVLYIAGILLLFGTAFIFLGIFLDDKATPSSYSPMNTTSAEENNSVSEEESNSISGSDVCPQCGGTGYYWDRPGDCPVCGGSGRSS